jgi:hypothetical protein
MTASSTKLWTGGRGVPKAAMTLIDRVLDDVGYEDAIEVEFLDAIPFDSQDRMAATHGVLGDTDYGCKRCTAKIRVKTGQSPMGIEQTVLHELAHVLYRDWNSHSRGFFEVAFSLYGTYGRPEWLQNAVSHDASNFADAMYIARQYGIGDMVPPEIVEYHAHKKKIERLRSKCWYAIYRKTPVSRLRFLNRFRDPSTDRFTTADMNLHGGANAIHAVLRRYHDDEFIICMAMQLKIDPKYIPTKIAVDCNCDDCQEERYG